MRNFRNKVAVVTGAGSGMGRAIALLLAQKGCSLAISDFNEDTLNETENLLAGSSKKVTAHLVDVADRDRMIDFTQEVIDAHGKVNLLFNNAGVSVTNTVEKMPYEDFEWLMNINFWGVVNGCKSFLPHLKQADEAHIINTSSIFGIIAVPSQAAYNASKFAVRGFTGALKQELQDTNVNVSCVHPGGVKTNIIVDSRYTPTDNEALSKEEFVTRFNELAGLTPDEAAEIILRGVLKNKARILVGKDALFVSIVERLFPVSYPGIINKWLNWGNG